MIVKKCDICKKVIKKGEVRIYFEADRYKSFEICLKCAEPILKFLKNKKLIKTGDLSKTS